MNQSDPIDGDRNPAEEMRRALQSLSGTADMPIVDTGFKIEIDYTARDGRDDDRFLVRFYGVCIFMIGLMTIIPSLYHWIQSSQLDELQPIPRWVYILGFVGVLHLLYSIFLFQIVDYSSLQSLAGFLLLVTCLYGFAAITLWLGNANGNVARFLQLPSVLMTRSAIWCGVMFGISALGCYLLGREAVIFRRRNRTGRR